jgi:hypothetical protein
MRRIIFATVATVGAAVTVAGCGGNELLHSTERSLLSAVAQLAPQELAGRGYQVVGQLTCGRQPGSTKNSIRIRCTGSTKANRPIVVLAAVEKEAEKENFTILVDGQPVVENVRCLAQDCKKRKED